MLLLLSRSSQQHLPSIDESRRRQQQASGPAFPKRNHANCVCSAAGALRFLCDCIFCQPRRAGAKFIVGGK
jgi:hypothetical protein